MGKPKKQIEFYFEGEKSLEDVLLELIIIKIAARS